MIPESGGSNKPVVVSYFLSVLVTVMIGVMADSGLQCRDVCGTLDKPGDGRGDGRRVTSEVGWAGWCHARVCADVRREHAREPGLATIASAISPGQRGRLSPFSLAGLFLATGIAATIAGGFAASAGRPQAGDTGSSGLLWDDQGLFGRGPVMLFRWRNHERWPVEHVSASVGDILGYAARDFLEGRVLYAHLIHPDDRERFAREMQAYNQDHTERVEHQPYRLLHRDGRTVWVQSSTAVVRDSHGAISHYVGYVLDVTNQHQAEAALRMCEERLAIKERITQTLHEISEAVNTADDLNGLYAYIHQALNRIIPARNFFLALLNPDRDTISFPYEVDERSPNSSVVIAADDPRSLTVEVLRTRKPLLLHDEELSQRYDSGRNRVWNAQPRCWLGVPLIIGDRAIGVMAVQDYERGDSYGKEDVLLLESTAGQVALALERKRTEKALRENEERLRALINATPDIICFKDGEGRWLEANDADLDLFSLRGVAYHGKTDAELAGMTPPLYREAFLACEGNDDQAWQAGGISRGEERMPSSDGTTKVYDVIKVPVFAADGTRKGLVVLGRDITERKRAEEKLLASLREKEILLKEVHHRVKNNMQVICSLLSLATRSLHDPAVQDIYRESVSRIRSMALVHEKLYRSSDLSGIDFGDYLSTVTAELIRSLASGGIRCSIDAEPVFLGVDTAIPCGLIVNELVSNALKHAFLGRGEGIVQVSLRRTGEEAVEISVRDNGIGFPEGQDLRSLSSMGMTLIVSLAEQIGGTVRVEIDGGSRFVVTFPA